MDGVKSFFRAFVFHIKMTVREKSFLFWTLSYPILLAVFFNLAFGGLLNNEFEPIPVGISPDNQSVSILKMIDVFEVKEMEEEEANELLKTGKIIGFIDENTRLLVEREGTGPTVIKGVLDLIEQVKKSGLPFENFHFDIEYVRHLQQKEASITVIFYSLIGMVALYGMYSGIQTVYSFQGNLSSIGARVQTTPINRLHIVLAGFLTGVLLNLISNLLLLLFMRYILHLDLFTDLSSSLLLILLANFLGVALGIFLSISNKMPDEKKIMLATMTSLFLSALSGMMGPSLRGLIHNKIPVINRINPVSIIADNMYRLNFLNDKSSFGEGLIVLGAEALCFLVLSFIFLRREQYDSI